MKNKVPLFFAKMLFSSSVLIAQVQVSKEPLHKNVLENKYIRLLDVWLKPGDTSLFHIHSTPSVFLHFSNTTIGTQVKGQDWVRDQSVAGKARYSSFSPDILVHRVSNLDTIPFHVTDIEILSSHNTNSQLKPLPFTVLFENEKVVAYRLTGSSFINQTIKNRGPLIAQLVSGNGVLYNDAITKHSKEIINGKHLYIEPGASFYFSASKAGEIDMVLFEIK